MVMMLVLLFTSYFCWLDFPQLIYTIVDPPVRWPPCQRIMYNEQKHKLWVCSSFTLWALFTNSTHLTWPPLPMSTQILVSSSSMFTQKISKIYGVPFFCILLASTGARFIILRYYFVQPTATVSQKSRWLVSIVSVQTKATHATRATTAEKQTNKQKLQTNPCIQQTNKQTC